MKQSWSLMREIIRVDLITMKGGKNSTLLPVVLFTLIITGAGFCITPVAGLYIPLMLGGFFVPMLFNNEMKYHSEPLWSLLPMERKDLVNARFLLCMGLFITADFVFYLLMLMSLSLSLWKNMDMKMDIIEMMAERMGLSRLGFFNLCYFGASSFGFLCMTSSLRKYFRDPAKFNIILQNHLQKSGKKEIAALCIIFAVFGFWLLITTGMLPLGEMAVIFVQLVSQLSHAANGFLLGAVFMTIAAFHAAYEYTCTLIEYDQREL